MRDDTINDDRIGEGERTVNLKVCPMHMPERWAPPVPAFSAMVGPQDRALVLYAGLQNPNSRILAEFNALIVKVTPPVYDLAVFIDRAKCKNYVLIAYFPSPIAHAQWEDLSGFSDWRKRAQHQNSDYGLWLERFAFNPGQFETLFSTPDSPEGICRQTDGLVGPIREHAYPGAAEDRIPNAAPGKFAATLKMPAFIQGKTLKQKIIVQGPANLCLIRSGQDFTSVKGEELQIYRENIEPALARGLAFLAENSDTGCFESRHMTHCDRQWQPLAKTFGMQIFLSIRHMMEWANSHPTHLDIFNSFQAMAMERQGDFDLRLWHEVAVMEEGDSCAEYVNCHPKTGMLPYAQALQHQRG